MNSNLMVLALNSGSSSLKASVIKNNGSTTVVSFLAERLGTSDSIIHAVNYEDSSSSSNIKSKKEDLPKDDPLASLTHGQALTCIIDYLRNKDLLNNVLAVGHRVVHGGTIFQDSAIIEEKELKQIQSISHLAPLHNPHNVAGIECMRDILQGTPNVAIFDTSFHSSIPERAYTYPLPPEYRSRDMRKFGFHGTSVKYVSQKATEILSTSSSLLVDGRKNYMKKNNGNGNDENLPIQMIVCHLGNGASVTAVSGDKSVETSMGFTPLSGLMMGTRCGDVDPSLVSFACHQLDKDVDEVLNDFNKRSGLKGMTHDGQSDMRELLSRAKTGDAEAVLAVDMFVYHLSQHIASFLVALEGPVDAIIFTAGIGEHSSEIRKRTVEELSKILPGLVLDPERNEADGGKTDGVVSKDGAWPIVLDIATDEEAMIAKECIRLVKQH